MGPTRAKVAVVAGDHERRADRRVDATVRETRGAHGRVERTKETVAHRDAAPRGGVHARELRVVAEAAAREVDGREFGLDEVARGNERVGLHREDGDGRSERVPARGGERGGHDPPETTDPPPESPLGGCTGCWKPGSLPPWFCRFAPGSAKGSGDGATVIVDESDPFEPLGAAPFE